MSQSYVNKHNAKHTYCSGVSLYTYASHHTMASPPGEDDLIDHLCHSITAKKGCRHNPSHGLHSPKKFIGAMLAQSCVWLFDLIEPKKFRN